MSLNSIAMRTVFLGLVVFMLVLGLLACRIDGVEKDLATERVPDVMEGKSSNVQNSAPTEDGLGSAVIPIRIQTETSEGTSIRVVGATPTMWSDDTSTSTPESAPQPTLIVEHHYPCGPFMGYLGQASRHFLFWTTDGSHLVFNDDATIWKVDSGGSEVEEVLDANPGSPSIGTHDFLYGFHADPAPDGTRLAYTSCQFPTELEQDDQEATTDFLKKAFGAGWEEWYERERYHYEIALSNLDGSSQYRLTSNRKIDHYPVWSPSGDRIAFVSRLENKPNVDIRGLQLNTISANGTDVEVLTPEIRGVALYPPVWSPDGIRLAFLVNPEDWNQGLSLYTVGRDGSGLVRIGETLLPPTWSLDSKQLAFLSGDERESRLQIVRFDATEVDQVWTGDPIDPLRPISQVSWSPDGSKILIVMPAQIHVVTPDGIVLRTTSIDDEAVRVAWSPDGARLALYFPAFSRHKGGQVLTMASDGSDIRVLAE